MIQMIKKTSHETHFWQVWKGDRQLVILSGILGEVGQREEMPLKLFQSAKNIMKRLTKEKVNHGYEYVDEESLTKLAVQYRYEEESQFDEAEEKCLLVGDELGDALLITGNGNFYGGEVGEGVGVNFFHVTDVELALTTIISELHRHHLLKGVEIAISNAEGEYISIYPEDAEFEN